MRLGLGGAPDLTTLEPSSTQRSTDFRNYDGVDSRLNVGRVSVYKLSRLISSTRAISSSISSYMSTKRPDSGSALPDASWRTSRAQRSGGSSYLCSKAILRPSPISCPAKVALESAEPSVRAVRTRPGWTAKTATLYVLVSSARQPVKRAMAAFDAEYAELPPASAQATPLDILMIRP